MLEALDGAGAPPEMADAGAQAAAGSDPVAVVEAAVEAGAAADEHQRAETPTEVAALVSEWWDRTADTADFAQAVSQRHRDLETLEGGTEAEKDDPAEVTVNHVYRNAIQTVALTVPAVTSTRWKPREETDPLPGMPTPPAIAQRRRQQQGLAGVMTTVVHRLAEEAGLEEIIEAWVQDSVHFRMAIVKVWWQENLAEDPIGDTRLPDEQDLLAKAREMVESFDRGDFTSYDARYQEMRQVFGAIGKTEVAVNVGIVVEGVRLDTYRCDPSVTCPEQHGNAAWESHDILMTRDEVLEKWDHIHADDLEACAIYQVDETGRAIRREREDRTTTTAEVATNRQGNDLPHAGEDWLLCREIYDYRTNHRVVLVQGLEYPAVNEPLAEAPLGMSPFVILVENRRSGSLYGFSDTELQAKCQRQLNRMRSQEEDSRRKAQPRWAANASAFPEVGDLTKAEQAAPHTITPVRCTSGKALTEEIVPLAGNHEHNPEEFNGEKLVQEMRKMAMLPEQASGELGQAEFATEVQVAAAGANALAKYRQKRITRAITKLYGKIAQLALFHVDQEMAVRLAGPLAAMFWPAEPPARQDIYEGLEISLEVAMDRQLDYARRADSLAKLIDAFGKTGVMFDKEVAGRLLAKFLDLGDEAGDLIKPDPNDLVARLMQAMQDDPTALAPEALLALAQLGQAAVAQAATAPPTPAGAPPAQPPGA